MSRRFVAALASLIAVSSVAAVEDRIDWPGFLARHDMTWDSAPRVWHEGAFIGNGLLGSMIYAPSNTALRFDVGRSDVGWRQGRIAIGWFELRPATPISGADLRLDLWNAELRGTIETGDSSFGLRAFTHAADLLNVVEIEPKGPAPSVAFVHEPVVDARKFHKKEPIDPKDRQPDPTIAADGDLHWCVQTFSEGGGYVVAWGTKDAGGRRLFAWTVDYSEVGTIAKDVAVERVRNALARGAADLTASHRAWWHAWWPRSFLSIPDTRLESFYWLQLYKLASATRADRPAIDLMGPWFRSTPWPKIWWNLNIQLTYWPVYAANRLDLGESLTHLLDAGTTNLINNVPEAMRADSAGIGRTSWYDLKSGPGREIGSLTWVMHNYWLHYRFSGDETMLRERFFPLLRRTATYMIRRLEQGADGRLHFPKDVSPEYPQDAPDTNYNLALLRWALQTMIATDERLGLKDPDAQKWRDTLAKLAPYPVDDKSGYMIGAGVPLAMSHRHFSHLFMLYPLHLEDLDSPAARPLLEKSLDHWISFEGALQGYSFTGASAMSSWLRRKGVNASLLGQFIDRYVKPNTMYLEAGPVIETPLSGAASTMEIVLQSWAMEPFGTHIRPFPAVPDAWQDAAFHKLLAEGAFEVSAVRRGGRTLWIEIKSLAGNPCRVETGFDGDVEARGARTFSVRTAPDRNGRRISEVDLKKGETVLLFAKDTPPAAADLVMAPVAADPKKVNSFGARKVVPLTAAGDGSLTVDATTVQLNGDSLVIDRKEGTVSVGGWTKAEAFLSWRVRLNQAGPHRVSVSYGSPRELATIVLSLEKPGTEKPLARTLVNLSKTGGQLKFRDSEPVDLNVPAAGDYVLTLRPAGQAPIVNLQRVTVKPST